MRRRIRPRSLNPGDRRRQPARRRRRPREMWSSPHSQRLLARGLARRRIAVRRVRRARRGGRSGVSGLLHLRRMLLRCPGRTPVRRGRAVYPACSRAARQASSTRSAMRGAENGSACARPAIRGSGSRRCGASASRQTARSNGAHSVPATSRSACGMDADRRGQHRHVARQRLEHGQAEALARATGRSRRWRR